MVRETRHLWVGNLPENVRDEKIIEHFKRYGRVESVKILPKRGSDGGVAAFVDFVDIKSAQKAHNAVNKMGDRDLRTDYNEPGTIPGAARVLDETVSITSRSREVSGFRGGGGGPAYGPPQSLHTREGRYERRLDGASEPRERSYDHSAYGHHERGTASFERTRNYDQDYYREPRERASGLQHGIFYNSRRSPSRFDTHESRYESRTREAFTLPSVVHRDVYRNELSREARGRRADRTYQSSRSRSPHSSQSRNQSPQRLASQAARPPRSPSGTGSRSRSSSSDSLSSSSSTSSDSSDSSSSSSDDSPARSVQSAAVPAPPLQPLLLSIDKDEPRKSFGIKVQNLPVRSTDTSLKDGLFHEFKKYGKVTSVQIHGVSEERYGLVFFRQQEDQEKALTSSKGKLFFGMQIEVTAWVGPETESENEFRPLDDRIDEFHPKATRTLFIGNLEKTTTHADLHTVFQRFGEIVDIDIKKLNGVPQYAFLQYSDITSVCKAIKKMDGEYLGSNRLKLGFGKSMPTNCVWIDGLCSSVSDPYLTRHFSRYGPVLKVAYDRFKGMALIIYSEIEFAQAAVKETKGRKVGGTVVKVDFANQESQLAFYGSMETSGQDIREIYEIISERRGDEKRRGSYHEFTSTDRTYYDTVRATSTYQEETRREYPARSREFFQDWDTYPENYYEQQRYYDETREYRDFRDPYEQDITDYRHRRERERERERFETDRERDTERRQIERSQSPAHSRRPQSPAGSPAVSERITSDAERRIYSRSSDRSGSCSSVSPSRLEKLEKARAERYGIKSEKLDKDRAFESERSDKEKRLLRKERTEKLDKVDRAKRKSKNHSTSPHSSETDQDNDKEQSLDKQKGSSKLLTKEKNDKDASLKNRLDLMPCVVLTRVNEKEGKGSDPSGLEKGTKAKNDNDSIKSPSSDIKTQIIRLEQAKFDPIKADSRSKVAKDKMLSSHVEVVDKDSKQKLKKHLKTEPPTEGASAADLEKLEARKRRFADANLKCDRQKLEVRRNNLEEDDLRLGSRKPLDPASSRDSNMLREEYDRKGTRKEPSKKDRKSKSERLNISSPKDSQDHSISARSNSDLQFRLGELIDEPFDSNDPTSKKMSFINNMQRHVQMGEDLNKDTLKDDRRVYSSHAREALGLERSGTEEKLGIDIDSTQSYRKQMEQSRKLKQQMELEMLKNEKFGSPSKEAEEYEKRSLVHEVGKPPQDVTDDSPPSKKKKPDHFDYEITKPGRNYRSTRQISDEAERICSPSVRHFPFNDDDTIGSPRLLPIREFKVSPEVDEKNLFPNVGLKEDHYKVLHCDSIKKEHMSDSYKGKFSAVSPDEDNAKWESHHKQDSNRMDVNLIRKREGIRKRPRDLEPGEVPSESDDDADRKSPKVSSILDGSRFSFLLRDGEDKRDKEDRLSGSLERHRFLDKTITPDTKALLERAKSLSSSREENWSFLEWDSKLASFRTNKEREKVDSTPRPIPSWYMKKKKIKIDPDGKSDDKKDDHKEEEQEKQELFASRFLHSSIFEQDSKRLQHLENSEETDLGLLRPYGRQLSSDGIIGASDLVQEPVVLFHSRFIELTRMQQKEKEKEQKPKEQQEKPEEREIPPKTPQPVPESKEENKLPIPVVPTPAPPPAPQLPPQPPPQPAPQSAPQPATQPSPQSAPQPATQPPPQSAHQPAPQPATQPSSQPAPQSAPPPATQQSPQPAPQSASQPATQPSSQPATQPSSQPAPQPSSQPAPKSAPQLATQPSPQPAPPRSPQPAPQRSPQLPPQRSPQLAPQPSPQLPPQPSPQLAPQPSPQLAPQPSPQQSSAPPLSPQPAIQPSPQPPTQPSPQPPTQPSPQPPPPPSPQPPPPPSPQPASQPDHVAPIPDKTVPEKAPSPPPPPPPVSIVEEKPVETSEPVVEDVKPPTVVESITSPVSLHSPIPVENIQSADESEVQPSSLAPKEETSAESTSLIETKPPTPGAYFSEVNVDHVTSPPPQPLPSPPPTASPSKPDSRIEDVVEPLEETTPVLNVTQAESNEKTETVPEEAEPLIPEDDVEAEPPVTAKNKKAPKGKRSSDKPATRKSVRIDREKRNRSASPRGEPQKHLEAKDEHDRSSRSAAKSPISAPEPEVSEPSLPLSRTRRNVRSIYATTGDNDGLSSAKESSDAPRSTRKRPEKEVPDTPVAAPTTPRRGRPPKVRKNPSPNKVETVKQDIEDIESKDLVENVKSLEGWRSPRSQKSSQSHSPISSNHHGKKVKGEFCPLQNDSVGESNEECPETTETAVEEEKSKPAVAKEEVTEINDAELDKCPVDIPITETHDKTAPQEKALKSKPGRNKNSKKEIRLRKIEIRLNADEVKGALRPHEGGDSVLVSPVKIKSPPKEDNLSPPFTKPEETGFPETPEKEALKEPKISPEEAFLARQIELEQAVENIEKITETSVDVPSFKEPQEGEVSEPHPEEEGDKSAPQASETELAAAIGSIICDISADAETFPPAPQYPPEGEAEVSSESSAPPAAPPPVDVPEANRSLELQDNGPTNNESTLPETIASPRAEPAEHKEPDQPLSEPSGTIREAETDSAPKRGRAPRKPKRVRRNSKKPDPAESNIVHEAVQVKSPRVQKRLSEEGQKESPVESQTTLSPEKPSLADTCLISSSDTISKDTEKESKEDVRSASTNVCDSPPPLIIDDVSQSSFKLRSSTENAPITPPRSTTTPPLPITPGKSAPPVTMAPSPHSAPANLPDWMVRHEENSNLSTPPPALPPDTKASDIDTSSSTLRKILMEPKYVSSSSATPSIVTAAISEPVSASHVEEPVHPQVEALKPVSEEKSAVPLANTVIPPATEAPVIQEKVTIVTPNATSVISRMPPSYAPDDLPRITLAKHSTPHQPAPPCIPSQKIKQRQNTNDSRACIKQTMTVIEDRPSETGPNPGLRVNTSQGVMLLSYSGNKIEGPQRITAKISPIPPASAVDIEMQQAGAKTKQEPSTPSPVLPKGAQTPTSYQPYNASPVISSIKQERLDKSESSHISVPNASSQPGAVKVLTQNAPPVLMHGQMLPGQIVSSGKKITEMKMESKVLQPTNMSPHHPSLSGKLPPEANHVGSGNSTPDRGHPHISIKSEPHSPCTAGHSPSPYTRTCHPTVTSSPALTSNPSVMLAPGIPVPPYLSSMHSEQTVIMPPHSVTQSVSLGHLAQGDVRINTPPLQIQYGMRPETLHSPRAAMQAQMDVRPQRSNTPQSTQIRDMVLPTMSSQHAPDEDIHYRHPVRGAAHVQSDVLVLQPEYRMPSSGMRLDPYGVAQDVILPRDVRMMMPSHITSVGDHHQEARQSRTPEGPVKTPPASKTPQQVKDMSKTSEVKLPHPQHGDARILSGLNLSQQVVMPHGVPPIHSLGGSFHDYHPVYTDIRTYHPAAQLSHPQFPAASAIGLQSRSMTPSQVGPDVDHPHSNASGRSKTPQVCQDGKIGQPSVTEQAHHAAISRHPSQLESHILQRAPLDTPQTSYPSPVTINMKHDLPSPHHSQKQPAFMPSSAGAITRTDSQPHIKPDPSQRSVDMVQLLTKYPIVWQGLLALKNDTAAVQLHFVSGNNVLAHRSLPAPEGGPPLRIAQRMRLEATQLEGVARRMTVESDYCLLLALPCGRDQEDVVNQTESLKAAFITYLQAKQAAGIINVPNPGSNQPAYVLQIFPPCEFSESHLCRLAPDLLASVSNISPHLMIVIALA